MSSPVKREISLLQAASINMIDMVGIGPFVVMPLVIRDMGNHLFLWAWIFGAVIAFADGMIWAELGTRFPLAGGSYNFLRAAYPGKWGRLMSFLFVWQTCLQAPLVVASAAIGFSQYFCFLVPLTAWQGKMISGTVVILIVLLLYRNIKAIGKLAVFLWAGVIITIVWIIVSGLTHQQVHYSLLPEAGDPSMLGTPFALLLGQASVKTIYSYLGYYNVCHIGGDIRRPEANIPRSIFISIFCIAALYLLMNVSVVSVIPWQEASKSQFVVSSFMEKVYGHKAAIIATVLVLWIAFASLFGVLLGYSRVPYAAAADGQFFPAFARLHPTRQFPHVSLLFLGATGFVFSLLFKLSDVISAILAMRILVQFIAQAMGLMLLRRKPEPQQPYFRMWLYPLPVILSVWIWLFVFYSTGHFALVGLALAAAGVLVFFLTRHWWQRPASPEESGR